MASSKQVLENTLHFYMPAVVLSIPSMLSYAISLPWFTILVLSRLEARCCAASVV